MKWKISYLSAENIIYIKTHGKVSVTSIKAMINEAQSIQKKYKSKAALIDHRKLFGKLSTMDIYSQPEFLNALSVPMNMKLAIIFLQSQYEDFKFLETVSKSRGYSIAIFLDVKSAKKWLINT